ncbi:MAG: hypothetical protein FWC09_04655 [Lachnospiraceae bacterium]|nr:hypothetical protein [Lachnospiraceae bacterium]
MEKKNILALSITLILALAIGVTASHFISEYSQVYKICVSEAGVAVKAADFFRKSGENAYFTTDSQPFDLSKPGEYTVRLRNGWFTYKSTLIIEDTIPPHADAVIVKRLINTPLDPNDFVAGITDATPVTVSFVENPDNTAGGLKNVDIRLTDISGNQTIITSKLQLSELADNVTIEAGAPLPNINNFVIIAEEAQFANDYNHINTALPGEYIINILIDGMPYETILHIIDTIPPTFSAANISGFSLLPRNAEDFVTDYFDISPLTFSFEKEPDLTYIGTRDITIIARDAGGNEARQTVQLTLLADTEPPEIKGVVDFNVQAGDTIAYKKNAVAIDNNPIGLEFIVDQSAVLVNTVGSYPVTYIARDFAGNETKKTITLTVVEKKYDLDEVYAKADEVLARIVTEDMSEREILWAIYRYNQYNIFFEPTSEKETWVRAAYEGLFDRRGDCYVYACTAKVLLDRAGIKNEDIEKIVTSRRHYWHLVDIGDGWYHYDTTPRSDHPTIFMWTDEQLMEYSAESYNSHRYDRDIYPADRRPIN